jgi:hypothetical protein
MSAPRISACPAACLECQGLFQGLFQILNTIKWLTTYDTEARKENDEEAAGALRRHRSPVTYRVTAYLRHSANLRNYGTEARNEAVCALRLQL